VVIAPYGGAAEFASFSLAGSAALDVAGGSGYSAGLTVFPSGSGGFGRVFVPDSALRDSADNITVSSINYLHLILTQPTATLTVNSGAGVGLAMSESGALDHLTVNSAGTVTLMEAIDIAGTATVNGTLTANPFDNVNVGAGVTWGNQPSASNGRLEISVNQMTIGASGLVTMDAKGYAGGISFDFCQGGSLHGPGIASGNRSVSNVGGGGCGTHGSISSGGGGGSYGTAGTGRTSYTWGGVPYGESDFHTALYLGSGGGGPPPITHTYYSHRGGFGAGAILIEAAQSITMSGTDKITARGEFGGVGNGLGGGGSGGTIVLVSPVSPPCTSTSVSVAGGAGGNNYQNQTVANFTGTGGSGRCLVILTNP
jgi:hypothetical protein